MAQLSFTSLANLLFTNFGPLITEGITQRGPGNDLVPGNSLFGLLQRHGGVQINAAQANATKPLDWAVHSTTLAAVSYGANDVYTSYTPDGYEVAQLDWKRNGTPFSVDALESWALGKRNASRGDANEVERAIKQRLKALIDKINTDLGTDGTGNSGKDFTGFKAFLAASGTYAGLDLTDPYWAPTVTAVGGAITKALIDAQLVSMEDKDGITDSLVMVMRRNQWHRVRNLFSNQIEYRPGTDALGDPFAPIYSDGDVQIPIEVVSGGMPADEIWFLNMADCRLYFADQMPNTALGDKLNEETIMHEGIPVGIAPVFENTDNQNCWFRIWGQLACEQPRRQGALLTLTI